MNKAERNEISQLPYKYRPLTMWSIIGWSILFNLFLIGFVLTIVFSCLGSNINRRSLARFWLFFKLLGLIILGVAIAVLFLTGTMDVIIQYVQQILSQFIPF